MNFEENIESYINNDLSEGDRHAFEKAMATDAALRQSVDEQRLIINLLRQNRAATIANNTVEKKRLKGVIDGYIAELPDVEPQKQENTEGGYFGKMQPIYTKKNRTWWAAAASVAVVAAAGIWLIQPKPQSQTPVVVQKTPPIVTPPEDSLKKIDVPKVDNKNILVQAPKAPPQYPTPKKVEKTVETPTESIEKISDEQLATVQTIIESEKATILEPSKGSTSEGVSKEDQNLLNALAAIKNNKPAEALSLLQNKNSDKARYYHALALLLSDRKKGKTVLMALANDADLETYFRNKIKDLLKKLD